MSNLGFMEWLTNEFSFSCFVICMHSVFHNRLFSLCIIIFLLLYNFLSERYRMYKVCVVHNNL